MGTYEHMGVNAYVFSPTWVKTRRLIKEWLVKKWVCLRFFVAEVQVFSKQPIMG
jgi:hypothetical protein